jgi:hypothetical protein
MCTTETERPIKWHYARPYSPPLYAGYLSLLAPVVVGLQTRLSWDAHCIPCACTRPDVRILENDPNPRADKLPEFGDGKQYSVSSLWLPLHPAPPLVFCCFSGIHGSVHSFTLKAFDANPGCWDHQIQATAICSLGAQRC